MFIEHGSIEINNKYNINSSINSTINSSIDSYKYFTNSKILKINNQNNIEKNWVSFVNNEDEILFIKKVSLFDIKISQIYLHQNLP